MHTLNPKGSLRILQGRVDLLKTIPIVAVASFCSLRHAVCPSYHKPPLADFLPSSATIV